MHDPAQGWGWRAARQRYYAALTEADPVRREALWADLFRTIGQIMHLVVDASVPEHARNDMHPLGAMKIRNSYEHWVARQHEASSALEAQFVARYLGAPIGFAEELLAAATTSTDSEKLLPVARLVDADRYTGANPAVTVGTGSRTPVAAGLAEIANANFFSEDTLRGQYPSPTDAGLVAVNLVTPLGKVRRYFSRPPGQGLLPANPLKAECASDAMHLRGVPVRRAPYPCVDPLVWGQVAMHMLPRAVGYARGVLDYFFRGSLAVTGVTWNAFGVRMDIQNTSGEEMEGVFEVWARHHPDTSAERRVKLATLGDGERIRLEPGEPYTFEGIPIPFDARPSAKHLLVFRGRHGVEEDGVAAQVFTVPYVDVRQSTYTAGTRFSCRPPTGFSAPAPYPKTTLTIRNDAQGCGWEIVEHHVTGTLETNMPIDTDTGYPEVALARIEARWTGSAVPAPLIVDGRSVGDAWQRSGDEPDPVTFEIRDQAVRHYTSILGLVVTYTSGSRAEFTIARVSSAVLTHEKMMLLDNRTIPGAVLVGSRRSTIALLSYDFAARFEVTVHGGVAPPVWKAATRAFGNSGIAEGIFADRLIYMELIIDHFQTFSASAPAQALYDSIELRSPHPDGPWYSWHAELRRLYAPMEREFLRAFVTSQPMPFIVTLTGRPAGTAGTQ